MDPLSIAAGCASLVSTISTLSLSIHEFVRTCREARKDLDKVSRELQSLQSVLRLIEDDATDEEKPVPQVIGQHVLRIVSDCNSVILEIETCIAQYGQKRLKAQVTWATGGQGDVEKLRTSLEAHKLSLELALDVHSLALTKEIKADTTEIRNDTMATRENTERILQQIDDLKAQLPKHVITPNEYVLQRFLEEMTTYTELSLDAMIAGSDDDSIRAFYDVEEASAASPGRSQSDGSLTISSDEPRPPNVPEAKRASEPPAKVIPGGDLTTQEKAPSQQSTTSRKAVEHVPFQWTKFFLPANDAKYPVIQGPSENEATSTQQRAPAMETPTSKDSDTRAREQKFQEPWVGPKFTEAPTSPSVRTRPLNLATSQKFQAQPLSRVRLTTSEIRRPITPERRPQSNRTEGLARMPSKDEATEQKRASPMEGASISKRLGVRTGESNVCRRGIDEPMEAPIPKNHGGGPGTSDELQHLSLGPLDGVLPKAPLLRTSPGDSLVAPAEPHPQISHELATKKADLRHFVRKPVGGRNKRAESSSPRESKDEVPPPDFNTDSKVLVRQNSNADATEGKEPKNCELILTKPTFKPSGGRYVVSPCTWTSEDDWGCDEWDI